MEIEIKGKLEFGNKDQINQLKKKRDYDEMVSNGVPPELAEQIIDENVHQINVSPEQYSDCLQEAIERFSRFSKKVPK